MEKLITPCYILNKHLLDENITAMKNALDLHFSKWIIGYSFKTNSLLYVVDYMKHQNCYAEVVSHQEYELAKHVGYKNIIYNGPMKSQDTFIEALNNNAIVNIETHREVEWLKNIKQNVEIGLRINFDIEKYCPNESACGSEGGRFGFCFENGVLEQVITEIRNMSNVTIKGIHLHVSTKTRSLNIYKAIANIAKQVIEKYSLHIDYIDVGGGFFGGMPEKPTFNEYFQTIKSVLGDKYTIIVEPGASLIASPFDYLASVIDVKNTTYNRFVVLDGSRNDLDPQFKKSSYLYELHTNNSNTACSQVIAGYTCMEHDRLMTLKNAVALQLNDRIQFKKVGSYTMCLAPNFIKYAPRVYLYEANDYRIIKEQWGINEYIAGAKKYE